VALAIATPVSSAGPAIDCQIGVDRESSRPPEANRYTSSRLALTPGTRLGPYDIIAAIGAGGMGEVYRARDARLARDVAIKVLPTSFAADPDRRARFEREAQAVAALSHPNIIAIFDTGVHEQHM